MQKTTLILDAGSTHMGNPDTCRELVRVAKDCGADAIKFQMLTKKEIGNGNIPLPRNAMNELIMLGKDIGIKVFASVFDKHGIGMLARMGCDTIKFAYSQLPLFKGLCNVYTFENIYFSTDYSNMINPEKLKTNEHQLFCIPQYPVMSHISFEDTFRIFDGFSDHTLGWLQAVEAVNWGAKIIEKHFTLHKWPYCNCYDAKFALTPNEVTKLRSQI